MIEDDPQDGADHVSGDRSTAFVVGPYVQHEAVVSKFYTTVTMLRTIEDVLGISHLGVRDAGVEPMTDVFDTNQECMTKQGGGTTCWSYSAGPAQILYTSSLPLPKSNDITSTNLPHPTHDAGWWEAKTKGLDFSREDLNDPATFNRILWEGLMGDKPYPTTRSGTDLRKNTSRPPTTTRVIDPDGSM